MSLDFFINEQINVTQNTKLSPANIPSNTNEYDYILTINVREAGADSLNALFTERNYKQDPDAPNNYISTLTLNNTLMNTVLMNNKVSISSTKTDVINGGPYTGWDKTAAQSVGKRFLEIVATKLFGNPLTTAAIVNDNDFTDSAGPTNTVKTGIANSLVNKKNDFFNLYVATDRIQQDQANNANGDANTPFNYNMEGLTLEFNVTLSGTLVDANGNIVDSAFTNFLAGPNVGGNQLLSGQYNVPLLLRLTDYQAP
jgi:hypothetical protein